MPISLTKEQVYEMYAKRARIFTEILEEQLGEQYPSICYNRNERVEHCARILKIFIDVVYSGDI